MRLTQNGSKQIYIHSNPLILSFPDTFHPSESMTKIFSTSICKIYSVHGLVKDYSFLEQWR